MSSARHAHLLEPRRRAAEEVALRRPPSAGRRRRRRRAGSAETRARGEGRARRGTRRDRRSRARGSARASRAGSGRAARPRRSAPAAERCRRGRASPTRRRSEKATARGRAASSAAAVRARRMPVRATSIQWTGRSRLARAVRIAEDRPRVGRDDVAPRRDVRAVDVEHGLRSAVSGQVPQRSPSRGRVPPGTMRWSSVATPPSSTTQLSSASFCSTAAYGPDATFACAIPTRHDTRAA